MLLLQVVLPDGYLKAVYEEMRAEGAVCVADEVRTTFSILVHASTIQPLTGAPGVSLLCNHDVSAPM